MAYTTDADIIAIRPNICDLGVDTWDDFHDETTREINQTLEMKWYRAEALERRVNYDTTTFDADNLDSDQVKRLACYKVLSKCYEYLMKGTAEPDGMERLMHLYQEKYDEELNRLFAMGISYDWDEDGTVEQTEKYSRGFRRLSRA